MGHGEGWGPSTARRTYVAGYSVAEHSVAGPGAVSKRAVNQYAVNQRAKIGGAAR